MHVMVPTLLKIEMIQFVLNVNLTLIILPHLNSLGDVPSIDPLTTIHLTTKKTRNTHADPNLQLSVSTNKLDQMAKLLEVIKQMTKFFKGHSNIHQST